MRLPSGSVSHAVRKSSEPSGDDGSATSTPRPASAATVVAIDSTVITKWLSPGGTPPPSRPGSWTSSRETNSSPGSWSIVRLPSGVSGTLPATW
jgi:hypothetical protein